MDNVTPANVRGMLRAAEAGGENDCAAFILAHVNSLDVRSDGYVDGSDTDGEIRGVILAVDHCRCQLVSPPNTAVLVASMERERRGRQDSKSKPRPARTVPQDDRE